MGMFRNTRIDTSPSQNAVEFKHGVKTSVFLKVCSATRPWLFSLITAALAYLYLPSGWYVPVGAISGIASAFFLIGDEA